MKLSCRNYFLKLANDTNLDIYEKDMKKAKLY
jgi:hypothetical protein